VVDGGVELDEGVKRETTKLMLSDGAEEVGDFPNLCTLRRQCEFKRRVLEQEDLVMQASDFSGSSAELRIFRAENNSEIFDVIIRIQDSG